MCSNLDELEALFDDDEFIEETSHNLGIEEVDNHVVDKDLTTTSQSKEELEVMENEYHELQKKMLLLQEKMKGKKEATSEKPSQITASNERGSSQDSDSAKRSFCDAFSSVFNIPPTINDCEKTASEENKDVSKKDNLPDDSSKEKNNFYPSQKKSRVSLSSQNAFVKSHAQKTSFHEDSKKKGQQAAAASNLPKLCETEYFSKIRLKSRYIDANEMKQRMEAKLFLKLSLLRPTMNIADDKDWVTIAVVAKQMDPQTAKNGKNYSIWHLSDLDESSRRVSLFLFGKVHEELWRNVTVGTVIGLLNPSIMPPKKEGGSKNYDNTPALTVDVAERVMKIGVSADLSWCKATKFRDKQPVGKCLAVINKQHGEVCVYHMKAKYKKMSAKRGELQSSSGTGLPSKYKQTLWNTVKGDQFFYGGQTFSAAPPAKHNTPKQESKMKLTDILGNVCSVSSQPQKSAEVERSKVMQAISGIEEKQSLTGCSDKFAEMLASGDMVAGSRQFLNHLQKKKRAEEEKKPINMSAADFLKQQKQVTQNHTKKTVAKSSKSGEAKTSNSKENSVKSKSASEVLQQMKRDRFMKQKPSRVQLSEASAPPVPKPTAPQLGGGVSSDREVDLFGDWLSRPRPPHNLNSPPTLSNSVPSLAELRKRKAVAKLRSPLGQVQVKPRDLSTSSLVIGSANKTSTNEKIKRRVEANRKDIFQKNSNLKKVPDKQQMSSKEFDRILKATSSHSNELDMEEIERQEEYFNPLIKKEMLEMKMSETFEISTKVVTCQQCSYTYWAPHERCKELQHNLSWKNVKKKFFECTKCTQRTTTWETYPLKACRDCGSEKLWKRTCMWKSRDVKLESETLLVRGVEHSKFLNTMKSGAW